MLVPLKLALLVTLSDAPAAFVTDPTELNTRSPAMLLLVRRVAANVHGAAIGERPAAHHAERAHANGAEIERVHVSHLRYGACKAESAAEIVRNIRQRNRLAGSADRSSTRQGERSCLRDGAA